MKYSYLFSQEGEGKRSDGPLRKLSQNDKVCILHYLWIYCAYATLDAWSMQGLEVLAPTTAVERPLDGKKMDRVVAVGWMYCPKTLIELATHWVKRIEFAGVSTVTSNASI